MIHLSNGLKIPESAYNLPYHCIRMKDVVDSGIINEDLVEVLKFQEDDFIPIKNKFNTSFISAKTFKTSLEYSKNTFNDLYPEDSYVFLSLKKLLKGEYLEEEDKDHLLKFIEKNGLSYHPDRLAFELSRKFYGKVANNFSIDNPLLQLVSIITLGYSEEIDRNGLKGFKYSNLSTHHKKDLLFFFDLNKIDYSSKEDYVEVICPPFVEYYHYFFNEGILNLSLESLDKFINSLVSILGVQFRMSKRASYSLVFASMFLHLHYKEDFDKCPILYRTFKSSDLSQVNDKCYEVYISTIEEDNKRLYQDFILTKDNLFIRVINHY